MTLRQCGRGSGRWCVAPAGVLAVLAHVGAATSEARAQTTSFDCLPPVPPAEVSPELLRDFEGELRAEYSAYFDEAQTYLACLDAAGRTVRTEVQAALKAYQRLFPE